MAPLNYLKIFVQHLFGEEAERGVGRGEGDGSLVSRLSFASNFPCGSALAPGLHAFCKKTHINWTHLSMRAVWGPSVLAPSFSPGSFTSYSKQLIKDFFSLPEKGFGTYHFSSFWLIAGDD